VGYWQAGYLMEDYPQVVKPLGYWMMEWMLRGLVGAQWGVHHHGFATATAAAGRR
jgi:hypothetical protein